MTADSGPAGLSARLDDLAELARQILPSMFDEATGLFSQKTLVDGDGYRNAGGVNPLYSAMALIGILRQPAVSPDEVVPVGRALDALHTVAGDGGRQDVVGNVLWASALAGDDRGRALARALADRLPVRRMGSVELAHALHGLVATGQTFPEEAARAREAAELCSAELLRRFSPRADLFHGGGFRPTGVRTARALGITSFAAQVYPLHALAALHRWTGEAPPEALRRVADKITGVQGPIGQWWWIYSPFTGTILEGYPVYAVHQDGMAFMGLAPLDGLGVGDYAGQLALGLDWLVRGGELSTDLVTRDPAFICRCIQRSGSDVDYTFGISRPNLRRVLVRQLRARSLDDQTAADPEELEVARECRSYELGWLLYAQALVAGRASVDA